MSRTRLAHLVCESPKHPGKVANVGLVAKRGDMWVPWLPDRMTGRNARLRGVNREGNITREEVVTGTDVTRSGSPEAYLDHLLDGSSPGIHVRYKIQCPLCRYTVPITEATLDRALNEYVREHRVWRVDLHDLAAKVRGK